jgi:ERCC4-type nuclease
MLRAMGQVNGMPESFGADVIWMSDRHGLAGVQRKTVSDLIGSVRNGLLGRELSVMVSRLKFSALVIEGQPRWSRDGVLADQYQNWTIEQQAGVEWWAQSQGVWVSWTRDTAETVTRVEHLRRWLDKEKHGSLLQRPNAPRSEWGTVDDRTTAVWLMSGMPGIGTELAGRIFDHFGRLPIGWLVEYDELLGVPGIGPKKAKQLWSVLGPPTSTPATPNGNRETSFA